MSRDILLIDLSGLAHMQWHVSASEPDPNWTSTKVVERVRALASSYPYTAVCIDTGRSFRKDIDPTYKSQRPEHLATLQHQIELTIDTLRSDGFPIWGVSGLEADDVIGSAVACAMREPDVHVRVVSSDKDLLALVSDRVSVMSATNGQVYDESAVIAKYKIKPSQFRDFLALVGDVADGVVGARGIGPARAATLLNQFDSLVGILDARLLPQLTPNITPALVTAINDFRPRALTVLELVTLRTDADIPFEDIWKPRVPADADAFQQGIFEDIEESMPTLTAPVEGPQVPLPEPDAPVSAVDISPVVAEHEPTRVELLPAPQEYERQLEPRSMREAKQLAIDLFQSRLLSAYGSPQAVLSTILAGREFGLQAMQSLRAMHIVDGKHMLAADFMRALVQRSGLAEYFRCIERTAERATFETKRKGEPEAIRLTYTIEEARKAWAKDDRAWTASGWGRNPADMLIARAGSKLARLVYPETAFGMYAPEEMD